MTLSLVQKGCMGLWLRVCQFYLALPPLIRSAHRWFPFVVQKTLDEFGFTITRASRVPQTPAETLQQQKRHKKWVKILSNYTVCCWLLWE